LRASRRRAREGSEVSLVEIRRRSAWPHHPPILHVAGSRLDHRAELVLRNPGSRDVLAASRPTSCGHSSSWACWAPRQRARVRR
jgi:hypothetical protein